MRLPFRSQRSTGHSWRLSQSRKPSALCQVRPVELLKGVKGLHATHRPISYAWTSHRRHRTRLHRMNSSSCSYSSRRSRCLACLSATETRPGVRRTYCPPACCPRRRCLWSGRAQRLWPCLGSLWPHPPEPIEEEALKRHATGSMVESKGRSAIV